MACHREITWASPPVKDSKEVKLTQPPTYWRLAILGDICKDWTVFLLCFLTSHHLWSIKEPGIQAQLPLLLLLSHFSRVRLCATPQTAAHQAPLSLGFSRQEHWSGLPFPSPMHESEKWKWCHSVVSNPQRPHELQPSRLLRPWDFPGKSTGVGCHCLLHTLWYLTFKKEPVDRGEQQELVWR